MNEREQITSFHKHPQKTKRFVSPKYKKEVEWFSLRETSTPFGKDILAFGRAKYERELGATKVRVGRSLSVPDLQ